MQVPLSPERKMKRPNEPDAAANLFRRQRHRMSLHRRHRVTRSPPLTPTPRATAVRGVSLPLQATRLIRLGAKHLPHVHAAPTAQRKEKVPLRVSPGAGQDTIRRQRLGHEVRLPVERSTDGQSDTCAPRFDFGTLSSPSTSRWHGRCRAGDTLTGNEPALSQTLILIPPRRKAARPRWTASLA